MFDLETNFFSVQMLFIFGIDYKTTQGDFFSSNIEFGLVVKLFFSPISSQQ